MPSYIYIMSNKWRTTLYIGVTNNLERRVLEHKRAEGSEFTTKYNLKELIYFEEGNSIEDAIAREKQLKNWEREWKMELIREMNPELEDLSKDWYDEVLIKDEIPERS